MAKQINFGIIYGMGRNKLAVQLNVPVDECVRALELLLAADKKLAKKCSNLTPDECRSMLNDHLFIYPIANF